MKNKKLPIFDIALGEPYSGTIIIDTATLGVQNTTSTLGSGAYANTTTAMSRIKKDFPEQISANEVGDTIEMVFKQTEYTMYINGSSVIKVFKIVYSCVDGKWNKSEPIYGKIISPQEETYEFD